MRFERKPHGDQADAVNGHCGPRVGVRCGAWTSIYRLTPLNCVSAMALVEAAISS